jgi:head-tail adaptor
MSTATILVTMTNATATVERPATDGTGYTTVASGVVGVLEPVARIPDRGSYPYVAQGYESAQTHVLYCATSADVTADDRITVDGLTYRVLGVRNRAHGTLGHLEIPLAAYAPGG